MLKCTIVLFDRYQYPIDNLYGGGTDATLNVKITLNVKNVNINGYLQSF